jgi:hypothetical protein
MFTPYTGETHWAGVPLPEARLMICTTRPVSASTTTTEIRAKFPLLVNVQSETNQTDLDLIPWRPPRTCLHFGWKSTALTAILTASSLLTSPLEAHPRATRNASASTPMRSAIRPSGESLSPRALGLSLDVEGVDTQS